MPLVAVLFAASLACYIPAQVYDAALQAAIWHCIAEHAQQICTATIVFLPL